MNRFGMEMWKWYGVTDDCIGGFGTSIVDDGIDRRAREIKNVVYVHLKLCDLITWPYMLIFTTFGVSF